MGVDGFVMATDGVLDVLVKDEYEKNRIYYPLIEPALKGNTGTIRRTYQNFLDAGQDYLDFMKSPYFHEKVTDDITFITCVNPERILQNPYKFDEKAWKYDDQFYQIKRKKGLYGGTYGDR